jgi:hypothetical protein
VIPDGLFAFDATGQGEFVSLPPPSQQELERLALGIVKALFRILERRAQNPADPDPDDAAIVQDLSAAAKLEPRCPPPEPGGGKPTGKGELAVQVRTDLGVFSLHAGTCVPAHDRKGLERLLRYGARPAFAHKRLSWTDAGKLEYRLRKPYFTGQTALVIEPVAFLRRLAALVPPRGQNQVRYYGALANRSRRREQIVGAGLNLDSDPPRPDHGATPDEEPFAPERKPATIRPHRLAWAKLLARVFEHDVLVCPACAGPRSIIAAVTDLDATQAILQHLGLPTESPAAKPARAPPPTDFEFDHVGLIRH